MTRGRAGLLLVAVLLSATRAAAQPLPPEVESARTAFSEACRRAGGTATFGDGFLRRANITPDGRPDYVLDARAISCPTDSLLYCGSGGCDVIVIASVGRTYRRIHDTTARGVALRPRARGDLLLLTLHDSSCPPARPACQAALAWNGRRLAPWRDSITNTTPLRPNR
ncbi:hypothetical protein [Muricoccus radiodurans]|uniref:hypothetical protein n=1 Tax=Muricoccus radiodurans TaxID=2231721 RepID=UPI003CF60904